MRKPERVRFFVGAAVIALVAAACGSSKGTTAATTAATSGTTAAAPVATTAAPAQTTAAPAATTAPAPKGFTVDSSKCPADATTALAAGADAKIGITLPQTGPLAAFGAIAQGMQIYFDTINAKGGVDGHKLVVVAKDDGYDPKQTVPKATELIEQDKVLATSFMVGTPNVAATRSLFEASCTPQMFVGTGFPAWGDPKNHPWTVGGILAYNTEAKIWAQYIAQKSPGAKVAQLVFNNDFGKAYQKQFETDAKAAGLTIVETKLHEGTAANIDNEVTAILASNPDYVIGETTGAFCPKLMAGLAQGGYKGKTIISATCASVSSFFKPVDPAGNGVLLLGQQKDPSDPAFTNDPAMKQYYADVAQYGAGADPKNGSVLTGYNAGALTAHAVEEAAKLNGGLTRVNVMNAVWNYNYKLPLLFGGTGHLDGNTDAYLSEYSILLQYDATKKSQVPTGDTFDVEGKTGLFAG
jgi:branched-chain amino acid transport system substrate-binding protein